MEDRPKAKKARTAWEMDLQSRREGSFYWREVTHALEELARWLRMEMILFKKEIVHWDSNAQEIPGALTDRKIRPAPRDFMQSLIPKRGAITFSGQGWLFVFCPIQFRSHILGHPCLTPSVWAYPILIS